MRLVLLSSAGALAPCRDSSDVRADAVLHIAATMAAQHLQFRRVPWIRPRRAAARWRVISEESEA
jgi:hypothetical protein